MDTFFDFAEGSLAQGFSELVIPYPCTDFFLTAAFLHAFDSHLIWVQGIIHFKIIINYRSLQYTHLLV